MDLKNFIHSIFLLYPDVHIHSLTKLQDESKKEILKLGRVISREIKQVINKIEINSEIQSISMIGYSMGGLVFRAALPFLEDFKDYFNGFMTIATPHLGYMNTVSNILTAGMWVVGKFTSNNSVNEINLGDKTKISEGTIHRLSKQAGLEWFKTGRLIGYFLNKL